MPSILRIALCASLVAGATVVGAQVGDKHSTLPGTVARATNPGEALYQQKGCYQCHGLVGQGAVGVGPVLHPGRLDAVGFAAYVRGPSGQMPPYSANLLSDAELDAIYAWLTGLRRAPPPAEIRLLKRFAVSPSATRPRDGNPLGGRTPLGAGRAAPEPAPLTGAGAGGPAAMADRARAKPAAPAATGRQSTGAAVYAQNCAACHGAALEGGAGPALAGLGRRRTGEQLANSVRNPPGAMPKLYPDPVSEQELTSLVAYLQASGPANPPTRR